MSGWSGAPIKEGIVKIRGLPYRISHRLLYELLSPYRACKDGGVIPPPGPARKAGEAMVVFPSEEDAYKVVRDKHVFHYEDCVVELFPATIDEFLRFCKFHDLRPYEFTLSAEKMLQLGGKRPEYERPSPERRYPEYTRRDEPYARSDPPHYERHTEPEVERRPEYREHPLYREHGGRHDSYSAPTLYARGPQGDINKEYEYRRMVDEYEQLRSAHEKAPFYNQTRSSNPRPEPRNTEYYDQYSRQLSERPREHYPESQPVHSDEIYGSHVRSYPAPFDPPLRGPDYYQKPPVSGPIKREHSHAHLRVDPYSRPRESFGRTESIRMKGLPFNSSVNDIEKFFGLLKPSKIDIQYTHNGRMTGDALVFFESKRDADESLKLDGKYIGERYIKLYRN